MELPHHQPGQNLPDNESRIAKLEGQVLDLSVELKLLRQTVDALPEKISMLVKAEMAQYLSAQAEVQADRNVAFRKDIEGKLEAWRRENDGKLDAWRIEYDRRLEEWRRENVREMRNWFRGVACIVIAAVIAAMMA